MKGEKYIWAVVVMVVMIFVTIFCFFLLQDMEVRENNAGAPGNAANYAMLKFTSLGAGIGMEILLVAWIARTRLSEMPKVAGAGKKVKLKVSEPGKAEKPKLLKVRVAEPGKKEEKPKLLKLRAAEPEEEKKLKVRAVELSPAEKEGRIKEIIDKFWAEKGEASMDEVVRESAKYGITKRDVEKYIEDEKKRGKLDTKSA